MPLVSLFLGGDSVFPFFGRKKRLAPLYPEPCYLTIIEPFAGSAAYSTLHFDREVILIEKDERLAAIWRYLINVDAGRIYDLPTFKQGDDIRDAAGLTDVERYLIGFYINQPSVTPKHIVQGPKKNRWNDNAKTSLANFVTRIRHWSIIQGDYSLAPDVEATWFIDPPYSVYGGQFYTCGSGQLDYDSLGDWCLNRSGQIVVCEGEGADWLPFSYLADNSFGGLHVAKSELLYTKQQ